MCTCIYGRTECTSVFGFSVYLMPWGLECCESHPSQIWCVTAKSLELQTFEQLFYSAETAARNEAARKVSDFMVAAVVVDVEGNRALQYIRWGSLRTLESHLCKRPLMFIEERGSELSYRVWVTFWWSKTCFSLPAQGLHMIRPGNICKIDVLIVTVGSW